MAYRFFVDQNFLPVGRALALVRDDVLHPDHPDLPEVPCGTQDVDWLPIVGSTDRNLVVITRDKKIRHKPAELAVLKQHNVRMFVLGGSNDLTKWQKLELLVRHWQKLEKRINDNGAGPWVQTINAQGSFRDVQLTPAD